MQSAVTTSESTCYLYGELFEKDRGNPSGCLLTTVINCIVNHLLMFYTWLKIMKENGLEECANLACFDEEVRLTCYGDDFVMSVSDHFKLVFNPKAINEVVTKVGMKMTNSDKSEITA